MGRGGKLEKSESLYKQKKHPSNISNELQMIDKMNETARKSGQTRE